jgi:hypothetical protein
MSQENEKIKVTDRRISYDDDSPKEEHEPDNKPEERPCQENGAQKGRGRL